MPKVSVIVPIYNMEKYLEKCLDSLANQRLNRDKIQIILVDDGSTDRSGMIADRYADMYANFSVFHTENQGVSKCRKYGLDRADGEYIGFVDSDDYCAPDMFSKLLSNAVEHNLDVVACGNYSFNDNSVDFSKREYVAYGVMNSYEEVFNRYICTTIIDGVESVVLWNKLYKHTLLTPDVDFGKNLLEDYLINMQVFKKVQRFMHLEEPLYYYRISHKSLSRTFHPEIFNILLEVQQRKEDIFQTELETSPVHIQAAEHWFIKYVESICKAYFLFHSSSFNPYPYVKEIAVHPIVVEKAKHQMQAGNKKLFIRFVASGQGALLCLYLAGYSRIYKLVKR